eukprot:3389880-Alexandrium_andersonii.AAC.1
MGGADFPLSRVLEAVEVARDSLDLERSALLTRSLSAALGSTVGSSSLSLEALRSLPRSSGVGTSPGDLGVLCGIGVTGA